MAGRHTLFSALQAHSVPVHAVWFCAGPEHFAYALAPVLSEIHGHGQPLRVVAPPSYLQALRRVRSLPSHLLEEIESRGGQESLAEQTVGPWPSGSWMIHVVGSEGDESGAGDPPSGRLSAESAEAALDRVAAAGLARVLCVYDLACVDAWQADAVAERYHRWVAHQGRLLPITLALNAPPGGRGAVSPTGSPPRELFHSAG